jgi:hypothetical protein
VIVTGAVRPRATVSSMALSPDRPRRPVAQPSPPAWSAALVPSQRRAADRRSELARRRSAQRWLRDLSRR